jgi:hypothetical protein
MNKMISKLEKMSGTFKIKEHTSGETMEGTSEDLINAIKSLEEAFEDLGTDYSFDIESMIIKLQESTMRQMKEYEGNFAMQVKLQNYHNDTILNIISLNK